MRIDDVFLCVSLDGLGSGVAAVRACEESLAAGADLVAVEAAADSAGRDAIGRMAGLCREAEAMLVAVGPPERAVGLDVGGVHLAHNAGGVAMARAILGEGKLVGMTSASLDEARLAVGLRADYLVHEAGPACAAAFAALRGEACMPLFAGGVAGPSAAAELVAAGVCRLWVDMDAVDRSAVRESIAAYSRLLGRRV